MNSNFLRRRHSLSGGSEYAWYVLGLNLTEFFFFFKLELFRLKKGVGLLVFCSCFFSVIVTSANSFFLLNGIYIVVVFLTSFLFNYNLYSAQMVLASILLLSDLILRRFKGIVFQKYKKLVRNFS